MDIIYEIRRRHLVQQQTISDDCSRHEVITPHRTQISCHRSGQRMLLPLLPAHLQRMALFDLNTGARDDVVCNLRWEWEVYLEELGCSVFIVPPRYVKGRKGWRPLICNRVAQSIIEEQRVNIRNLYSPICVASIISRMQWRRCITMGGRERGLTGCSRA